MNNAKLFAALVAAQKAAHAVEKTSANNFHKYRYASTEAIIEEARGALGAHGLALYTASVTCDRNEEGETLHVAYVLAHESGEVTEITGATPIVPEKGRPRDKAVATAKTYDLGYTLRGLLLLPRVEEGTDVDQRDDSNKSPPSRRTKKGAAVEIPATAPPAFEERWSAATAAIGELKKQMSEEEFEKLAGPVRTKVKNAGGQNTEEGVAEMERGVQLMRTAVELREKFDAAGLEVA